MRLSLFKAESSQVTSFSCNVLRCLSILSMSMHMLWFKFILGLMFFELVSILFAIVPDYGNEYMTKENKN